MTRHTFIWWQAAKRGLVCLILCGMCAYTTSEAQATTGKEDSTPAKPATVSAAPASSTRLGVDSGLPLPRFASTGGKETNLRSGPGTRYPILWVYRQPYIPVEIIDEHDNWRQVRDPEGDTGWLHRVLLNGTRHVLFKKGLHDVRQNPDPNTAIIFRAKEGVHGKILHCIPNWCQVQVNDHQGWTEKTALFGVNPQEVF